MKKFIVFPKRIEFDGSESKVKDAELVKHWLTQWTVPNNYKAMIIEDADGEGAVKYYSDIMKDTLNTVRVGDSVKSNMFTICADVCEVEDNAFWVSGYSRKIQLL